MFGVGTAMFLSALDQTIVATAMPQIVREFNGLSHLSWVFTAYLLASTVTVPIYGKLSDIFGRRSLYIFGILIFLGGSALSGWSHSMTELILFRALQGIGGGAIMVNSFAIIGDLFPPAERGKWQGLIGGIFGLASIAGPLLGGTITDNASWRWVFYINIPVGIAAMAILASALPKIAHDLKNRSIDILGAFLIAAGLVPLLLALVWGGSEYPWLSWQILSLFGEAAIFLLVFAIVEKNTHDPLLSLDLFKNRVFSVSVITMFFTTMGMFGAILYIPLFAQIITGISATNSGLIMTPMMISLIIASSTSGQIISKTGRYRTLAILGVIITVIAMILFSSVGVHTTSTELFLKMMALGLGLGMTLPIFTLAVQSAFGREKLGEVTAGLQLFRSVGGTVGTAILGGVMNSQLIGNLSNIGDHPFVKMVGQVSPATSLPKTIDANTIQGVLSPESIQSIHNLIAQAPQALQGDLQASFDDFITTIKVAFSSSIDSLFIVGVLVLLIAVVVVFYLPEIPLRKTQRPVMEEIGVELEVELGQADPKREPQI
ncbi:MFS transporter [Candidatus Acetothermia bacterium]|nr:MFS transporter [Candidatus Acetothermia bacterium]MBI3642912.1 MFS transporter [Candidatus Acetothermia bacterium]